MGRATEKGVGNRKGHPPGHGTCHDACFCPQWGRLAACCNYLSAAASVREVGEYASYLVKVTLGQQDVKRM